MRGRSADEDAHLEGNSGLVRRGLMDADPTMDDPMPSFIRKEQEADGSWFGRWGVNYIYGTWQAVIGPIRSPGTISHCS